MLKRRSIKKICIATFCLLILLILYLFPKIKTDKELAPRTSYTVTSISDKIYLIDSKNYVARINVSLTAKEPTKKALEIIDYMTINSSYSSLIPNGFRQIIPSGTKVLSYSLEDNNFKINFSKQFLNVNASDELRLIEALVYSLTEIQEIKSITILIEGNILNKLLVSNEQLPNSLDRSYGINKKYDINSVKNTTKTTIYYLSKYDNYYYYIPVTKVTNDSSEKIEIIIKELTSRPIYETNLMSYLNSEAVLQNYELLNKELNIDFNNAILSDVTKNNILEEVTYAINLSIKDNYDVDYVMYTIDNKKIATFDLKSLE